MADCLEKALEAFPEVDRKDMEKVVNAFSKLRRENFLKASANPDAAFRADAKKLLDGYRNGVKMAQTKYVANLAKEKETNAFAARPEFKSKADGWQAILSATSKTIQGGRQAIDKMLKAHQSEMLTSFYRDMDKTPGAMAAYRSGSIDAEILKEQAELAAGRKGGVTGNDMALTIAKARQNLQSFQLMKMNDAGAMVNNLQGRLMLRTYDRAKLLGLEGKTLEEKEDYFVKTMLGWVNAEKSFKRPFENLNGEDVLRDIFRKVTKNQEVGMDLDGADSREVLRKIQSPANMARAMERGRTIHIDSPLDEYQFMKQFGAGSLSEETARTTMRTARRVALIERLGTNPELRFEAAKKGMSAAEKNMLDRHWANVDGSATAPGSSTTANFGLGMRLFQDMKSLAFTAVAHLPNTATIAALTSNEGVNFWGQLGDSLAARLQAFSPSMRKEFLHLAGINAEAKISSFHNAFSTEEGGRLRVLSKLHEAYMNLTLIRPVSEMQDAANGKMLAGRIGYNADKSFAELDPGHASIMSKYGVGPIQWDLIRAGVEEGSDGRMYGSLEGVRKVPLDKAKAILEKGGMDFTGLPDAKVKAFVERQQRDAATNLANYFNDRSAIATGRGGAFERAAFSNRGHSEDTLEGQLFRFLSQYKNYGFAMSSQFAPAMYNEAIKGAGAGGAALAAQSVVGMAALGYLAFASKQMLQGKSPPSPMIDGEFHPEVALKITEQALMHSGALGIFSSFLLDDFDSRHGKNFATYVGGPMLSTASDAMDLATDLRDTADRSNPGALKASAVTRFAANAALGNAAFLRQGLDYLVLNNLAESLNPGYSARMREKLAKEGQAPKAPWAQGYEQ